ncbi:unnamed protein product [Arabis nemorensis]|uniref:Citrate synthase n=1 Tax=Arabis nemorensis TaxID=586526 RepID=A0A565AYU2_9BRAS|nr:unnamed protein product [Arabis nemorensis]
MFSQDIIQSMPHDAHPASVIVSAMSTLSIFHHEANPSLKGHNMYKSKQVCDKQIFRILGQFAFDIYNYGVHYDMTPEFCVQLVFIIVTFLPCGESFLSSSL